VDLRDCGRGEVDSLKVLSNLPFRYLLRGKGSGGDWGILRASPASPPQLGLCVMALREIYIYMSDHISGGEEKGRGVFLIGGLVPFVKERRDKKKR